MEYFLWIEPPEHECDFTEVTTTWISQNSQGSETQVVCRICNKPYPDGNNGIIAKSDSGEIIFQFAE